MEASSSLVRSVSYVVRVSQLASHGPPESCPVRSQLDGKRPSRALEELRRSRRQGRNADYTSKWFP